MVCPAPLLRLAGLLLLLFSLGVAGCGSTTADRPGGSGSGGGTASGGATGTGGGGNSGAAGAAPGVERWFIDNTSSIHGLTPMVIGSPQVTTSPHGEVVCFDGDDGIVLDANPLQGLAAFTIEALVRVDAAEAAFSQPRYLHIETTDASRATLEARVTETSWYLDTFLLSGTGSRTLVDAAQVHPVDAWAWTALTYADSQMHHFVNGIEEASGAVTVPPFGPGKMSLGVRQNLVNWFKGCVGEVRVTPTALPPAELQKL